MRFLPNFFAPKWLIGWYIPEQTLVICFLLCAKGRWGWTFFSELVFNGVYGMHIPVYPFNNSYHVAGDTAVCDRFLFISRVRFYRVFVVRRLLQMGHDNHFSLWLFFRKLHVTNQKRQWPYWMFLPFAGLMFIDILSEDPPAREMMWTNEYPKFPTDYNVLDFDISSLIEVFFYYYYFLVW